MLLVALIGCSARRPVLYPNEKVERVGPDVVQRDIDDCLRRAEQFAASTPQSDAAAKQVAGDTAVGAGSGAAIGAVGGAISGGAGTGAAVGAATGATAGLLHGLFGVFGSNDPSPVVANFVNRCLHDRGYDVIGWQ